MRPRIGAIVSKLHFDEQCDAPVKAYLGPGRRCGATPPGPRCLATRTTCR